MKQSHRRRLFTATFVLISRLKSRGSCTAPSLTFYAFSGGPSCPRIRDTNGYESTITGGRRGLCLLDLADGRHGSCSGSHSLAAPFVGRRGGTCSGANGGSREALAQAVPGAGAGSQRDLPAVACLTGKCGIAAAGDASIEPRELRKPHYLRSHHAPGIHDGRH